MRSTALPSTVNTFSLHGIASVCTIALPIVLLLGRGASDITMSTVGILFLAHSFKSKDFTWLKQRWVQLFIAFWLYICLRSYFTEFPMQSLQRSVSWLRYPLFALALGNWVLKDTEVRAWLLYTLGASVLLIIADSLLQFVTGHDIFGTAIFITNDTKNRLTGPFGTPIVGVMLVTFAFPLCVWSLISRTGKARSMPRFLLGAVLNLLVLGTVLLSGERTAFILCLLEFGLLFIFIPIRPLYKGCLLASAAMVMGFLLFFNPQVMQRQIHSMSAVITDFGSSTYGEIWGSAIRIFQHNPVFGIGVLQFRNECPDAAYGPPETMALRCNYHPHNIYLEILAETGLTGFMLLFGGIGLLVARWVKAYPKLKTDPVFIGLIITMCARFFPLAPLTSFFISWYAIPLWLFVGWLIALQHAAHRDEAP